MPNLPIKNVLMSHTTLSRPLAIVSSPSLLVYNLLTSPQDSRSLLPALNSVVQSGIQVLVWAGDADFICNWQGNYDVANQVDYDSSSAFASKGLAPYTVNGKQAGTFKSAGNFSFLRVFGAGHEVPYYTPEVALQAFVQTMQKKAISST